ncbi:hypothetical protein Asi02nite_19100 [Asanoa siamensis]|uniref:MobA-like NTP transferase domain-containing protein n=1 Tax=Asanoa siamensis TaxID=926357 RepID=A0ABQ4CM70_9ACTN|nr:hypothetical protein Asi02nite_19100 [Asanoa siamensis]
MGRIAGIVIAAGGGRRIGGPEALLRRGEALLVDTVCGIAREVGCAPLVVVLGAAANQVRAAAALTGTTVVVDKAWGTGLGSSLRVGLEALTEATSPTAPARATAASTGGAPAVSRAGLPVASPASAPAASRAGLPPAPPAGAPAASRAGPPASTASAPAASPAGAPGASPAGAPAASPDGAAGGPVDAALVLTVDMPGVTVEAARRVALLPHPGALVCATYAGLRSYPMLLGRRHWPGIATLAKSDVGARPYLLAHQTEIVDIACDAVADGHRLDKPDLVTAFGLTRPTAD